MQIWISGTIPPINSPLPLDPTAATKTQRNSERVVLLLSSWSQPADTAKTKFLWVTIPIVLLTRSARDTAVAFTVRWGRTVRNMRWRSSKCEDFLLRASRCYKTRSTSSDGQAIPMSSNCTTSIALKPTLISSLSFADKVICWNTSQERAGFQKRQRGQWWQRWLRD